jgi:hypothetical protein
MGGFVTEEKSISRAQYLDLVYSQPDTLYDLPPNTPRPSTTATSTTPTTSHVVDGVIGTFHADTKSTSATHTNPKSTSSNVQGALNPTPSTSKTSEVKLVQSAPTCKTKSKKGKGKNKEDINNNLQSKKSKMQPTDDKDKHKPQYPCLIRGEDHYKKDCPRHVDVTTLLQGTKKPPTLVIFSQPFPSQQKAQLVIHDQPSPYTNLYVLMCTSDFRKNDVAITTRAKYYSPPRRKLTIYHLHWFNHLPQLHLSMVLFISNDRVPIQFFVLLPRVLLKILPLILMHELLKTTVL